jgi:hypothetical protein
VEVKFYGGPKMGGFINRLLSLSKSYIAWVIPPEFLEIEREFDTTFPTHSVFMPNANCLDFAV